MSLDVAGIHDDHITMVADTKVTFTDYRGAVRSSSSPAQTPPVERSPSSSQRPERVWCIARTGLGSQQWSRRLRFRSSPTPPALKSEQR
jgi:hypothetical protein